MPLTLERRVTPSKWMMFVSPIIAIIFTLITSAIILLFLGKDPANGLYVFFVEPLTQAWSLEEIRSFQPFSKCVLGPMKSSPP